LLGGCRHDERVERHPVPRLGAGGLDRPTPPREDPQPARAKRDDDSLGLGLDGAVALAALFAWLVLDIHPALFVAASFGGMSFFSGLRLYSR
jgi:hypothetical protein